MNHDNRGPVQKPGNLVNRISVRVRSAKRVRTDVISTPSSKRLQKVDISGQDTA